jgi:soluble lytic murein transglycosylase
VLLGESYLQSGKRGEARAVFNKLINELPDMRQPDDFALAGAKGLDILDGGNNETAAPLSESEHLKRAQIYQFNRDFAAARLHFEAIVKNYPASALVPDALYLIGRGFAMEENFVRAVEFFERVHTEFPASPIAPDALSQSASAFSRVNKPREAVARYQKIIEKYPEYNNLNRAYLNIVDVLRDAGSNAEALKWTQRTQEAFRGKLPEAVALFAQARIRFSQNDWQNALADLDKLSTFSDLGETRVPGGTNKAEIAFLKGFALEQMQNFPEAIDVYLSIPDGRGEYYGWRATERLRNLAKSEAAAKFVENKLVQLNQSSAISADEQRKRFQSIYRITNDPKTLDSIRKIYAELPAYKNVPNFNLLEFGRKEVFRKERETPLTNSHKNLADELLFLGLYDEATPELEISLSDNETKDQKPKTEDLNYTLAVFYKRGDMAHRAVGFVEPLWRNVPRDFLIELMPREQAELLYPAPYKDALLQFAPERKVDPRFVLAIMRQESRFRADVKSVAAARGLMQFIASTSNRIADELGRKNFRQDDLYNPPTAVLFGSQYLANLFKQFPAQPQAVAASYNGGETNMARWLARSAADDPDRYVAEIVFSQSKDYVYKVMANYRVYQTLYDENLKMR